MRSWLFSIAWRKAKGSQRRWFRAVRRDTAYHEFFSGDKAAETPTENRILLRQVLLSLPVDQRAAVVLCLGSGYTYVLRGRDKLRGILGDKS